MKAAGNATIPEPKFLWLTEASLSKNTWFFQLLRKIRRSYLSLFHRNYVRHSIASNREGECHRCGACCALVWQCPFLGHDSQNLPYCRIFGELRPTSCKNYPFDRIDSEIEQCGFKFK